MLVLSVVPVLRGQRREDQELKVVFGYKSEFKVRLGYVSPRLKNKLVKISLIQLDSSGIGTLTVSCPVTTVGHSELFSSLLSLHPHSISGSHSARDSHYCHQLLSASVKWSVLHILYTEGYAECGLWCLASPIQQSGFKCVVSSVTTLYPFV